MYLEIVPLPLPGAPALYANFDYALRIKNKIPMSSATKARLLTMCELKRCRKADIFKTDRKRIGEVI